MGGRDMADAAADLLIRIDATTAQLRREMARADQTVQNSTSKITRQLRNVDRQFDRLNRGESKIVNTMQALAAALAVRELVQFGKGALSAAEGIADVARQTDVTVERLQSLRFAFDQNGGSARELDAALVRFNRRIGLARDGAGP